MSDQVQILPARKVVRAAITQFAELTGDFSPIHMDRDYALSLGLKDNFAHGLLGASWAAGWLSQLHGSIAEVPTAIEFNFGAPVFCDDQLQIQQQRLSSESVGGQSSAQTFGQTGFAFSLSNQQQQVTSHGKVHFAPIENLTSDRLAAGQSERFEPEGVEPERLEPSDFHPCADKVYFARDMYEDGPRGRVYCHRFTADEVADYVDYTGESASVYQDETGGFCSVPPVLIFCRAFSTWLSEFLKVRTPDAGFPGHIQDQFQQQRSVAVGDELSLSHQVSDYRESRSRPDMALVTITLQVINQRDQLVQCGSVLLMMPLKVGAD